MDYRSVVNAYLDEVFKDPLLRGIILVLVTSIVLLTFQDFVAVLSQSSTSNLTDNGADHEVTKQESQFGVIKELLDEDLQGPLEETCAVFDEFSMRETESLGVDRKKDEDKSRNLLDEVEKQSPVGEILAGFKGLGNGEAEIVAVGKEEESECNRFADEEGFFDDWEGIERTDLEKRFGAAVAFVASMGNADHMGNTVKIQLQGLYRIATQGPCHDPQPMAFKFSARSEWKAWQSLGDMSRESAMEQYLKLLSTSIPEWEVEERK